MLEAYFENTGNNDLIIDNHLQVPMSHPGFVEVKNPLMVKTKEPIVK